VSLRSGISTLSLFDFTAFTHLSPAYTASPFLGEHFHVVRCSFCRRCTYIPLPLELEFLFFIPAFVFCCCTTDGYTVTVHFVRVLFVSSSSSFFLRYYRCTVLWMHYAFLGLYLLLSAYVPAFFPLLFEYHLGVLLLPSYVSRVTISADLGHSCLPHLVSACTSAATTVHRTCLRSGYRFSFSIDFLYCTLSFVWFISPHLFYVLFWNFRYTPFSLFSLLLWMDDFTRCTSLISEQFRSCLSRLVLLLFLRSHGGWCVRSPTTWCVSHFSHVLLPTHYFLSCGFSRSGAFVFSSCHCLSHPVPMR